MFLFHVIQRIRISAVDAVPAWISLGYSGAYMAVKFFLDNRDQDIHAFLKWYVHTIRHRNNPVPVIPQHYDIVVTLVK